VLPQPCSDSLRFRYCVREEAGPESVEIGPALKGALLSGQTDLGTIAYGLIDAVAAKVTKSEVEGNRMRLEALQRLKDHLEGEKDFGAYLETLRPL
jgi:hypothetical protein